MKQRLAFVVNSHGYIAHFLPIIQNMPDIHPIIFTPLKLTADYARDVLKLDAVHGLRDEHVWEAIREAGIKNVVICYQKIAGDCKGLNTMQIFHGVSFKGDCLANWNPERWRHVFVQGEHFWEPYVRRFASHRHKIRRVEFARMPLYRDVPAWDRTKPILYMPTHRDGGLATLRQNINLVCESGLPVVIKLHPINMRDDSFMRLVTPTILQSKNVQLITPDDLRYFNYHELFFKSSVLVSDFSSVACEYTLTDRPIVILRGGMRTVKRGWQHFDRHLFHCGERRDLRHTVADAKRKFVPGTYPRLFIEEDCVSMVQAIQEAMV